MEEERRKSRQMGREVLQSCKEEMKNYVAEQRQVGSVTINLSGLVCLLKEKKQGHEYTHTHTHTHTCMNVHRLFMCEYIYAYTHKAASMHGYVNI